jgi:hypothetical protein
MQADKLFKKEKLGRPFGRLFSCNKRERVKRRMDKSVRIQNKMKKQSSSTAKKEPFPYSHPNTHAFIRTIF